jgi:phosphoribosylamine--glycine ligase
MLKVLLIGSGAREHAIAKAIKRSQQKNALYCFANSINPGIKELSAQYLIGNLNNIDAITNFAVAQKIDFAVIGPEALLELGVVDELNAYDIPCIGPTKKLASIETSKSFARDLLAKYKIPASPQYKSFHGLTGESTGKEVKKFLQQLEDNFVIKADGLMGGKGVKISGEHLSNHNEAIEYCQQLISQQQNFVIEEKLIGQEFSLLSFSDGKHLSHMPPVQDHKRAFANDSGPNTGGMGSYTDANHLLPFLNKENIHHAQQFNQATINALEKECGVPYKGILYGGFMLTKNGVKLIEYNARFGDPEAINLLALLETDFIEICQAIIASNLHNINIKFSNKATVCKYVVPEGYPDNPVKNKEIDISKITNKDRLYYAAVNAEDNKLVATGSRTLAVLGIADNILAAEQIAEEIIQQISGPVFHRKDIGTAELINKKITQINQMCGTSYKLL